LKVILFYKFTPISDPTTVMFWQKTLCKTLGLKGRIIISKHGINGTLGGDLSSLKLYRREMQEHPDLKGIKYKWSDSDQPAFPRLSVKVRSELVSFGAAEETIVDTSGIVGGGRHIKPLEVNKLVTEKRGDVIFYDGRNMYEAAIGRFQNTVIPNTKTAKDFLVDIESGEISKYKDKTIITYCTGGIRCEILSLLMRNRGYKDVYQIDGGIVKYGETWRDNGLWMGKLFVFDDRMQVGFSSTTADIAECDICGNKTSNQFNLGNLRRHLVIRCKECCSHEPATVSQA
jgi:UPF0176 protein